MKSLILLLLSLFTVLSQSMAATLIDRGASWRWRPGTAEASTPVEAWRTIGFDDSAFTSAPAPFWYGDTLPGGTQITGMQNVYLSIFLRKTFVLTNLTEIGGLRMGSLVDDGFVAWINGTEVLRVNMPGAAGTAVNISTLANNQAVDPAVFSTNDLPAPPSYLVLGTNVLAVQVFQSSLGSSDFGFDGLLESIVSETNPPTVLSVSPVSGTVTNLTEITVTFSEPVSGVDASDLLVNGSPATVVTPLNASTYTFSLFQPAYGNVSLTWKTGHNIADQALPPNPFNATGPGATWSYNLIDRTVPSVASLTPAAGATVRTLGSIIVIFNEAVSGVDASDLLVNNSPSTGITPVAANQFIFDFTDPATGAVQVAWVANHGIRDQATVPNAFSGGSWTYVFDPNAADASPYISEFMASNTRTLADETGQFSDWIEIYNPSSLTVNLDGWYLTDSDGNLNQWRFPATNLAGGGFLVVFASESDRRIPGSRLHTNFRLSAGGEYLALVKPDGTIASEFRPAFPSQAPDVSYGLAQFASGNLFTAGTNGVYFTRPTPGAANIGGATTPGPVIEAVQHTPNVPLDHEDLLVTARVVPSFNISVASVTMRYRIMFSNEVATPMFDDGAHGDGAAGDNIFGATIPANLSTNGQMIRYFISATDVNANASRWPVFTTTNNHAQYLGTVVAPGYVTSKLPIFHLFAPSTVLQAPRITPATQQIGADSEAGGRVAIFYDGEFYDNVLMELRGNTSAGQNKKSHRLEFNREHLFRHLDGFPRIRKTSLMAEFLDPAYIRQHLSFWLLEQMGVPAPFFYPVRAQLNGAFYGLVFHNDVIDEEQVARMGYDPAGALYKAIGNALPSRSSTGVFQKKTEPLNDDSDYQVLVRAINETNTVAGRRAAAYDMLDIPEVINYLAGARWCAENDDVWANMSIYRDSTNGNGDGLWRIIPFDMNASWGQRYGGITPLDAIADSCKSHPLYGGSTIIACDGGSYNRIYDVIISLPETRQMLLRRQRSVLDRWVLEPGVAPESRLLESHIRHMTNLIWTEAFLDRASWGYSTWTASNKPLTNAIDELFNQFINLRRNHFNGTHSVTNGAKTIGIYSTNSAGIPLTQPANAVIRIFSVESNPSGGNQLQEYICVTNPTSFALDISGWKIGGAVDFTFKPGTIIPTNVLLYVVRDLNGFKTRTTGPRRGQGLFVVGGYKGQLSARGETILVTDPVGRQVDSYTTPDASSDAQRHLRVTEVMYNPSPLAGNTNDAQEFEYIEIKNISASVTLGLAGVRFEGGIDFAFTGSAITSLAPGARALVVRNLTAFTARYGAGLPVAGQYVGNLDNAGERIRLLDSVNEEILDFGYNNKWYPVTDGQGFSLVVVDENAEPDNWDTKPQWRASGQLNGSPGSNDPAPPAFAPVVVNEVLSSSLVPQVDVIELHNPSASAADIGGWYITDDILAPKKYRIPGGTTISAGGFITFDESQFNSGGLGFAFSSNSDEAWVYSGNQAGELTGYAQGEKFGAGEVGVSFGRYTNSQTNTYFVAQAAQTLSAANSSPKVGPVVISEIMYHPLDIGTNDNSADEFIELRNITGADVPLYDTNTPANKWKLTELVDFTFPQGVTIPAGKAVIVANINAADPAAEAAFRAKYELAPEVQVFGPYAGKLDNSGGRIELKKPGVASAGVVPYIIADEVDYRDTAPWPVTADGGGASLQRLVESAYGNDPTNWVAVGPSGGISYVPGGTPPNILTQPASTFGIAGRSVSLNVAVEGTAPFFYQWRFNGVNIDGANSATLILQNLVTRQAGFYEVVILNSAGSVLSAAAELTVLLPPAIIQSPASRDVYIKPDPKAAPSTNVTFTIGATSGNSALSYQWRFNGVDIPGATASSYTVVDLQLNEEGDYSCAVTDSIATVVSAPARLNALISTTITQGIVSPQIVAAGASVTLSVSAAGNPYPFSYEWRRGSVTVASNVAYSSTAYYTFTSTNRPFVTNQYRVIVRNLANLGLNANSLATNITLPDFDQDGLIDAYEVSLGLNTNNAADALGDIDLDGMRNRDEVIAGTDPANALSYLKIDSIVANGGAMVTFGTVSNRTYTVQFTDTLSGGAWSRLADLPARTTNRVEQVQDASYTTNRLYRLVTPQQP